MAEVVPYVRRKKYLKQLERWRDQPLIKVITGVRRCGKSVLLEMFRDDLVRSGVDEKNIVFLNLDSESGIWLESAAKLLEFIRHRIVPDHGKYIFLDEVQNIDGWETAAEALRLSGADVYITGSNSQVLSTDIAGKLSGRVAEIRVRPLVFREYLEFRKAYCPGKDEEEMLNDFIRWGGMPFVATQMDNREGLLNILSGIYNTVFVKDVIGRNKIRNQLVLSNISKFMMRMIGKRLSVKNVSGFLTSRNCKTDRVTIEAYVGYIADSLLFEKAGRVESRVMDQVTGRDKFFICDMGIRKSQVPFLDEDVSGIIENIVFNELLYRYGNASSVTVGPNDREIDFMSEIGDGRAYYQVTEDILDKGTREREIRSLEAMDDNYPKTVISLNRYLSDNIRGIRIVTLLDFLTEDQREQVGLPARMGIRTCSAL